MKSAYQSAQKRLLLLDYDGTLTPIASRPQDAVPDERLMHLLRMLSRDTKNDVIIISGRIGKELDLWFADIHVSFVAEHGAKIKRFGQPWSVLAKSHVRFLHEAETLLADWANQLPGSFIEKKDYSIAWHTRMADTHGTQIVMQSALPAIRRLTNRHNARMLLGKQVLEVVQRDLHKGMAADHLLSLDNYDFVLAAGDDLTDEYLFRTIDKVGFTVKIGKGKTRARARISDPHQFRVFLQQLME